MSHTDGDEREWQARKPQITVLLRRVSAGQEGALNELAALVYDEMRAMAERHLRRAFGGKLGGVTLEPTALVNETFIRLIRQRQKFDNRGHFFAIATKLMLRVLMDYHRQRAAAKRGHAWVRVPLDPEEGNRAATGTGDIPALIDALQKLEKLDSRKAEVVKLRVLWGLSVGATAEALEVAPVTVARDWKFAKAWLAKELSEDTR